MYKVDVYLRVRRAVMVEGMIIREASRELGLYRDTVRKMLACSVPPGYRRRTPPRASQAGADTGVIDWILEDDLRLPRKQRHTAKRIFERLRDEYGFGGKYTIVKDYVRERRRRARPSATSARPWWSLAEWSGRPIPPRPPNPSATGTSPSSPSWAACPGASSTTTLGWRWPGCRETAGVGAPGPSPSSSPTTCSNDRFGRPGKGNDKGKVKGMQDDCEVRKRVRRVG